MKAIGTCALCLTPECELCDSHIWPEFLYQDIYVEGEQGLRLYSSVPGEHSRKQAQGIYERLLCKSCEPFLNTNYETEAKKVIQNLQRLVPSPNANGHRISEVDYAAFKLFTTSLIWRSGVSKHRDFEDVSLGTRADRMRLMILNRDPGEPHQFPCILWMLPEDSPKVFSLPEKVEQGIFGEPAYKASIAGFTWLFILTENYHVFLTDVKLFIDRTNVLPVFIGGECGKEFLVHRGQQMQP